LNKPIHRGATAAKQTTSTTNPPKPIGPISGHVAGPLCELRDLVWQECGVLADEEKLKALAALLTTLDALNTMLERWGSPEAERIRSHVHTLNNLPR
jgi:hypothetical protein